MAIKVFHSAQNSAPTLSGKVGSLIALLDAVLVDGYGSVEVSSITPSGASATVVCAANHDLDTGDSVLISGATETKFNGEFVITVVDVRTFTYTLPEPLTTPASGTLKAARAPAGFERPFGDANKAVYRSKNPSSTHACLRVDDSGVTGGGAREATVRGYVSMTSIDDGSEPFPSTVQSSTGLFAYKSSTADATARPWLLVSDGKTFYFQSAVNVSPAGMFPPDDQWVWVFAFGDLLPYRSTDPYASFLAANTSSNNMLSQNHYSCYNGIFTTQSTYYERSAHGLYTPRGLNLTIGATPAVAFGHGWDQDALGTSVLVQYPNYPDGGFFMVPLIAFQQKCFRGRLPGAYEPLHGRCLGQMGVVEGVRGFPGRKFLSVWGRNASNRSVVGMLMLDITGNDRGEWD